jgi:hypothetical protein
MGVNMTIDTSRPLASLTNSVDAISEHIIICLRFSKSSLSVEVDVNSSAQKVAA